MGSSAPEAIRAVYDEKATSYDKSRLRTPFQLRFDRTERNILRHHLSGRGSVLEVGAGTGRLTGELLECSSHVTAVDISSKMLEELRRKYADTDRLDVRVWNAYELENLPGYGSFDALLSMRMLPHVEDITNVLRIFRDALRPGGLMMIDFWNRYSYVYWRKKGAGVYNHCVTYKEALEMIAAAELDLVAVKGAGFGAPSNINLEFLSRTPFKRFAWSLVALCGRRAGETSN